MYEQLSAFKNVKTIINWLENIRNNLIYGRAALPSTFNHIRALSNLLGYTGRNRTNLADSHFARFEKLFKNWSHNFAQIKYSMFMVHYISAECTQYHSNSFYMRPLINNSYRTWFNTHIPETSISSLSNENCEMLL